MIDRTYVYWIHLKTHDNPYEQGYVGVSKDVRRRICEHKSRQLNPILNNVFKKHQDVLTDILFVGDEDYCYTVENQYRPQKEIGWNILTGGVKPPDTKGFKHTEETKKLISENNVGFKGRTHSEETRKKMSDSRKKYSRPQTEETKRKLSEIAKKRKFSPMKDRKHTEETRKLISQIMRKNTHNTKGAVNEQLNPI